MTDLPEFSPNRYDTSYKGENMIAVVSPEHTRGKTCIAINLAYALARLKKNVLLFDAAKGMNNIKAQLGLQQAPDLDKVVYGGASLNQIITSYVKGRFDLILSNSASAGLSTMSIGSLQIFGDDLNIISHNYDVAILDIESGQDASSDVLTGMCKTIIIVCADTVSSLTRSYKMMRDIYARYPYAAVAIIINSAASVGEGQRAYADLAASAERFLGRVPPLLGIVRQDSRIRDAIRSQTTIINRYPQAEASADIIAIAQRILPQL